MPVRAALRVFVAVALLLAWQAALVHPIVHVDELGELVHVHDGQSHEDSGPLCDTLAALTACAPQGLPATLAAAPAPDSVLPFTPGTPRVAEAPPFLSQAPPPSV